MHFYDIVVPEQLLQRLVIDNSKGSIRILLSKLLVSNFYPQELTAELKSSGETGLSLNDIQINRCFRLIQQDVRSAIVFYQSIHHIVSIGSTTKFGVNLFVSLMVDLEEVIHAIDRITADRTGNNKSEKIRLLMKSFVATLEMPIGTLQVLLAIIISIKAKLIKLSNDNGNEINETYSLFCKFFDSANFIKLFDQLFHCVSILYPNKSDTVETNEVELKVYSQLVIIWSLYLQLLSISASIHSNICYEIPKKKGKSSKNVSHVSQWSAFYAHNIQMGNMVSVLFDNFECYDYVRNMYFFAFSEAAVAINLQVI